MTSSPAAPIRLAFAAAAVLAFAGCGTSQDANYQSPYGPRPSNPLPNVPGGGLWNPAPPRMAGVGTSSLISRLPGPDWRPNATPASTSPDLPTPAAVAQREAELAAIRAGHAGEMDARLVRERRSRLD